MLAIENEVSVTRQIAICASILALAFAGCQQEKPQEQEVGLAAGPDVMATAVPSDFAAQAIEAAGGLDAWTKTKELRLDSVVALYQPDGSRYLSEQSYDIYPWSNSIRVSAREPQGRLVWQLSNGRFDTLQGGGRLAEMPQQLTSRDLVEAVLSVVTAPARLLDNSVEFTKKGSPVKLQGRWYQPIERQPKSGILSGARLGEATLYQNRDNSLIEILQYGSTQTGRTLTVRGYDYDRIDKGGPVVPGRIEIFTTDKQANVQDRLVTIDIR